MKTNIGANSPDRERRDALSVGVASGDGVLTSEQAADACVEAVRAERFWVLLPHPEVAEYVRRKGTDIDRWLHGMRRFQGRLYEGRQLPGDWFVDAPERPDVPSPDDPVFSTREGGVAEIVLNRPARRNAVTGAAGAAAARRDRHGDRGRRGSPCCLTPRRRRRLLLRPRPRRVPGRPGRRTGCLASAASGSTSTRRSTTARNRSSRRIERFAINAGSALALAADLLVAGEQAFLHVGEIRGWAWRRR